MSQELQLVVLWAINGAFIGYSIAGWVAYFRLGKTERLAAEAVRKSKEMGKEEK
jgi:hypothetical protein